MNKKNIMNKTNNLNFYKTNSELKVLRKKEKFTI